MAHAPIDTTERTPKIYYKPASNNAGFAFFEFWDKQEETNLQSKWVEFNVILNVKETLQKINKKDGTTVNKAKILVLCMDEEGTEFYLDIWKDSNSFNDFIMFAAFHYEPEKMQENYRITPYSDNKNRLHLAFRKNGEKIKLVERNEKEDKTYIANIETGVLHELPKIKPKMKNGKPVEKDGKTVYDTEAFEDFLQECLETAKTKAAKTKEALQAPKTNENDLGGVQEMEHEENANADAGQQENAPKKGKK
jgi:hypothetical protein